MGNLSCLGRALSHTKRCFTASFLLCTSTGEHRLRNGKTQDWGLPRSPPAPSPVSSRKLQRWPSKKILKINICIYIDIISVYLKWVIICLLLPVFFRLFTWNQQGLNHASRLMKAELLVDSHDSRRCCSLKSPGWWETLIISRELVTRAEDFE